MRPKLTKKGFRDWLIANKGGFVARRGRDATECPIATYLKRNDKSVSVFVWSREIMFAGDGKLRPARLYRNPLWVTDFVDSVNKYYVLPVPANAALDILDGNKTIFD